jgi:hypothetical protein
MAKRKPAKPKPLPKCDMCRNDIVPGQFFPKAKLAGLCDDCTKALGGGWASSRIVREERLQMRRERK